MHITLVTRFRWKTVVIYDISLGVRWTRSCVQGVQKADACSKL